MMKLAFRWLKRIKHIQIENKGLKILALLLAFILFVVSRQPISDVRMTGIQIEFRGLNPGMEVLVDAQQPVSVRLRGPRDIVRSLTPNQIAVIADLSDKEPGERNIQFREDDVLRPDAIQVLQIEPASIKFRIDHTVHRLVDVIPNFDGQVPKNFEIYNKTISPTQVEIEGPQSQVRLINSLRTETINLNDKKASFKSMVDVETLQHGIRVKTPGPIIVNVQIGESQIRRTLHEIPVQWQDKVSGYRLLTRTISVNLYGPESAVLSIGIDQISAVIRTGKPTQRSISVIPDVTVLNNPDERVKIESIAPTEIRLRKN